MRPMWEEQGWNEEPEGEEQGEVQQMSCLREEAEGDGKTYSMNMWLKAPEAEEGARRVGFRDEEGEPEDHEKEEKKLLALAAENGWKVAGWRGKGGREWRPTFGRQGR